MERYIVELWDIREGDPDRIPDAIVTVHATTKPYHGQMFDATERAVIAAQYRAERAAGSRGNGHDPRWLPIEWWDSHVERVPVRSRRETP